MFSNGAEMKKSGSMLIAMIVFGTGAIAQSSQFSGRYSGNIQGANGKTFAASLVLQEDGGDWVMNFESTRHVDPCAKAHRSIAVSRKTEEELDFVIKHAEIAGCTDMVAKLHRVDEKTLAGSVDGMKATFVRQ
jgi:hypothetical protein